MISSDHKELNQLFIHKCSQHQAFWDKVKNLDPLELSRKKSFAKKQITFLSARSRVKTRFAKVEMLFLVNLQLLAF